MTPTDVQIAAAVKAMKECSVGGELYYEEDYKEAAKAALTAAAEVDVDRQHWPPHLVKAAIAKERERCTQVALEWAKGRFKEEIEAAESIVHAIRALKE